MKKSFLKHLLIGALLFASVFTGQTLAASGALNVGGGSGTINNLPQYVTSKDEGTNLTTRTSSVDFVGAGVTATNTGGAVTITIPGGIGSAIQSLNGLTGASQTFANDTNVTISSSGTTHTLGWTGTLAAARLNSNVVQGVTNDTNVTGSISAQNLTLGWTGQLSVARGGTGLSSGTSGGVLYYSGSGTLASSGALTASALVVGGGAGSAPTSLALGTANQLLGMNAGGTANEYKTFATGTSGTDFAITHTANTVTFNIPDASATARGLVTTGGQTWAGQKTFTNSVVITGGGGFRNSINGNTTYAGLAGAAFLTNTQTNASAGNPLRLPNYYNLSAAVWNGSAAVQKEWRLAMDATSGASTVTYLKIGSATGGGSYTDRFIFDDAGMFGIGVTPRAWFEIQAGTTSFAPEIRNSGSLLSSPIAGAEEFLTDKRYFTITTGTARKEYTLNDIALTSGRVPTATTNGRLTDFSTFTYNGTTLLVNAGGGNNALSLGGGNIFNVNGIQNAAGNPTIVVGNNQYFTSGGSLTIDMDTRTLKNSAGNIVYDFQNTLLYDANSSKSIDTNARTAYDNVGGGTYVFSWGTQTFDVAGHITASDYIDTTQELLGANLWTTVRTINNNDSQVDADSFILADATGGNITFNLQSPSVNGNRSKEITVKKIDATANTITITPPSGTIDGAGTLVLTTQYESYTIQSDGTNYWIK